MNRSELADRLHELTASWRPSEAATQQDLRDARVYLADGFLSGIAPQQSQQAPTFHKPLAKFTRSETDAAAQLAKSNADLNRCHESSRSFGRYR
jgi:hypothetical protein